MFEFLHMPLMGGVLITPETWPSVVAAMLQGT
jgi:hypothetical protein